MPSRPGNAQDTVAAGYADRPVGRGERRLQVMTAIAVALVCAAVAAALSARRDDERTLRAANIAGAHGRYEEAITVASRLRSGTTEADAWFVRASAELELSNFASARTAFRRALRLRPNDWRARRELAGVLLLLGDRDAARVEYARALALNPRMPPLLAFTR